MEAKNERKFVSIEKCFKISKWEREIDFRGDEWKHDNEHSTLVYYTEEQTIIGNSVGNFFWGYKFMPKQMNQTDLPLLFTFF